MIRKGNFLITENDDYDIINIKHIVCIEKGNNKKGTKIKLINGNDSRLAETPDAVLNIIMRKSERG